MKENKALNALIERATPYIELQTVFERDLSDYTMHKYNWASVTADSDWWIGTIKAALNNLTEYQANAISFLLSCAKNYEFFNDLKDNGEWDKYIAEYGDKQNEKQSVRF